MLRRAAGLLVALVATIALLADAAPSTAAPTRESVEAEFIWRINHVRAEKGLPLLAVDTRLTAVAREWAGSMARAGRISHRPDLTVVGTHPRWVKVGENVGVGATAVVLHDAFVASPKHYENLIEPEWHYVGVGVATVGDTIYVAENFMQVEEGKKPVQN